MTSPISSLPRRWLIAAMAGMLVLVSIVGWLLQQAWVQAERIAERQAVSLASVSAQDIARTISQYDLSLQAVARGMDLPNVWDLTPEMRQLVLFDRAAGGAQFGFLNVLDASGNVVADMQAKTPRPANFEHRDYFQALRRDTQDQLFIGRPVLTAPGQPATLPIARRRFAKDGTFAGVVVGSMRLSAVQDVFAGLNLGPADSVALMRTDGVVLMRLPLNGDDIGRTVPADAPFFRLLSFPAPTLATDPDGVRRLTAQHRVGDLPLVVTVGLAGADIHAGWWMQAAGLGIVVLLMVGLGIAATLHTAQLTRARVRAEAAAERARADQVRATTTVSHELRSPLTSLLCYAEMLGEADLPPVEAGRVAAIQSAGEHLRVVIDRLIELTRSGPELDRSKPSSTDLDELVEQSRRLVEPFADRRGLILTSHIAPELPRHVLLDAANLRMVLNNLLTNALKYTEHGHVDLRVTGSPRRLRFEVADTGPGIPRSKRARLFKEFDRLDTDSAVPGSGYGLSVAHRMVESMGGAIGYDDNPGGGSLFWFEVPAAQGAAPVAGPSTAQPAKDVSYRILLVEDDATNSDVATTWLQQAGHQITLAANGAEGLHHAVSEEFDLIVSDMRMPEMTGLEMARHIRGLEGRRGQTPILLLSADMQVSRMPGYEEAQVTLLLPKPYNRDQLLGAVRSVVPTPTSARFGTQGTSGLSGSGRLAGSSGAPHASSAPHQSHGSTPPRVPLETPLFNEAALEELEAALDPQELQSHLQTLSTRIETLIRCLADQGDVADQELCHLAHDLGSTAGLMGFMALSAALREFQQASQGERQQSAGLARIAEESLKLLHARLASSVSARG